MPNPNRSARSKRPVHLPTFSRFVLRARTIATLGCVSISSAHAQELRFDGDPLLWLDQGPHAVVAADLDGDGDLDLAAAEFAADRVTVFLALGGGRFAPGASFAAGNLPEDLAAADLDGDGDVDLATADNGSSSVSVLIGNGDGTFAAPLTHVAGNYPEALAIGDVDGDGAPDLVVANGGSDTFGVYLNLGSGGFRVGRRVPRGFGTSRSGVVRCRWAAISTSQRANSCRATSRSCSTSRRRFGVRADFARRRVPAGARRWRPRWRRRLRSRRAEFHQRRRVGALELRPRELRTRAVVPRRDASLGALARRSGPRRRPRCRRTRHRSSARPRALELRRRSPWRPARVEPRQGEDPRDVALGDFDFDGDVDFAVANTSSACVSLLWRDANGAGAGASRFDLAGLSAGMATGDFDGDGDQDVVVTRYSSDDVNLLLNAGDGSFVPWTALPVGTDPRRDLRRRR